FPDKGGKRFLRYSRSGLRREKSIRENSTSVGSSCLGNIDVLRRQPRLPSARSSYSMRRRGVGRWLGSIFTSSCASLITSGSSSAGARSTLAERRLAIAFSPFTRAYFLLFAGIGCQGA